MEFEVWEPYYERILKDFGFSRAEDERAAPPAPRPFPIRFLSQEAGAGTALAGNRGFIGSP